jgi:hypothetical protein
MMMREIMAVEYADIALHSSVADGENPADRWICQQ